MSWMNQRCDLKMYVPVHAFISNNCNCLSRFDLTWNKVSSHFKRKFKHSNCHTAGNIVCVCGGVPSLCCSGVYFDKRLNMIYASLQQLPQKNGRSQLKSVFVFLCFFEKSKYYKAKNGHRATINWYHQIGSDTLYFFLIYHASSKSIFPVALKWSLTVYEDRLMPEREVPRAATQKCKAIAQRIK